MILIIGKSSLSEELVKILNDTTVVGRPEYDFSQQTDCDRLVDNYYPDVIINTLGILNDNYWEMLSLNYVSVAYLTLKFYEKDNRPIHIINISSSSTYWTSYPDIPSNRFCYNISKEALSSFGKHFNRKIINRADKKSCVTTIEPGKFNSRMNNFSGGMEISIVAEHIKNVITTPVTHLSFVKNDFI